MSTPKIAVLIPCYNESATIAKVVADYKAVLPDADIYVYDNNSTDATADIAQKAGATVRYERRQGKGNVIRSMFRQIEADCYLMVDRDDTYPAEDAPQMISKVLDEGCDMVIGDRLSSTYFTENKRPFHNTGNVLVRKLVNSIFGGCVTDIMTGYRAFALVLLIPVLLEYYQTGLVPRLPTFVASCFMALFSLQTFACGLILDTQGKQSRQNFEVQMNLIETLASERKEP